MKNIEGLVFKVNGSNVLVRYFRTIINKKYSKTLKKASYIRAHSDYELKEGDKVLVRSCAPISKTKKYIVIKEGK